MKHALLLMATCLAPHLWAQKAIDARETVLVGGIQQYITLQGKDDTAPLLLYLHGGPGGSVMSYAGKFTHRLQEHFIVVQWDQRQTGKTLELNRSPVPLTLKLFQEDTHALITTLLKRFHQRKLYLVAHSWGTTPGFQIAAKYPELLFAFIPIGPMIHQHASEQIALELMREHAQKTDDRAQLQELAQVQVPFADGEQLYYHRKWLFVFSGNRRKLSRDVVTTWADTWLSLYNEACAINLFEALPAIECPVYFFAGRKDYQTNSSLTARYYEALRAPRKFLFWFEKSGHAVPTSEPDRFQSIIIDIIFPETFTPPVRPTVVR